MIEAVLEPAAEDPAHEAAIVQQFVEVLVRELSGLGLSPYLPDTYEDHEVEDADEVEEEGRDRCADDAAGLLERRLEFDGLLRGDGDERRQEEHDRGVAEREEQSDRERLALLCEHESRGVVDRGDVVSVECVPESKRVRQRTRTRVHEHAFAVCEGGVLRLRVVVGEQAPARDVEERNDPEDGP